MEDEIPAKWGHEADCAIRLMAINIVEELRNSGRGVEDFNRARAEHHELLAEELGRPTSAPDRAEFDWWARCFLARSCWSEEEVSWLRDRWGGVRTLRMVA